MRHIDFLFCVSISLLCRILASIVSSLNLLTVTPGNRRRLIEHLRRCYVLQLLLASEIEIHITLIHLAVSFQVLILQPEPNTASTIFVHHLLLWVELRAPLFKSVCKLVKNVRRLIL